MIAAANRLYYGDESSVSETGYVPYGWQFADESVGIPSAHGKHLNCWGLLSRDNKLIFKTTQENINSKFVFEQLDMLSFQIRKPTVVVLDNASFHKSKVIKNAMKVWQSRDLYIVYLPPYSPNLNLIERLWKEPQRRTAQSKMD